MLRGATRAGRASGTGPRRRFSPDGVMALEAHDPEGSRGHVLLVLPIFEIAAVQLGTDQLELPTGAVLQIDLHDFFHFRSPSGFWDHTPRSSSQSGDERRAEPTGG